MTALSERPDPFADFAWRKPWVGPNYWTGVPAGRRLLLVGESHYGEPDEIEDRNLTVDIVSRVRGGTLDLRFFTIVQRACTGRRELDDVAFWNGVAFANYAQGGAYSRGEGTREEMLDDGDVAFPLILDILQPTHLVVFGAKAWQRLERSNGFAARPGILVDDHECPTGTIVQSEQPSRSARLLSIWHPARHGFGAPEWWHGAIGPFLEDRGPAEAQQDLR